MAPAESRKEDRDPNSGAAWKSFGPNPYREAAAANLAPGTRLLVAPAVPRIPPASTRLVALNQARPAPTIAEQEVLTLQSFDTKSVIAVDLLGAVREVPWRNVIAFASEWPIQS
jgi:hypothetical protein